MSTTEGFVNRNGKHQQKSVHDHWKKMQYLEWLCTPPDEREPRTKTALAKQLDVERKSLYNWQEDPDFLREWERMYLSTIGSPDRKSQIMDTLFKTATDPDDPKHVAAAKQYFEIEGSMRPKNVNVTLSRDPNELTDAALAAMIAAKTEELARQAQHD